MAIYICIYIYISLHSRSEDEKDEKDEDDAELWSRKLRHRSEQGSEQGITCKPSSKRHLDSCSEQCQAAVEAVQNKDRAG